MRTCSVRSFEGGQDVAISDGRQEKAEDKMRAAFSSQSGRHLSVMQGEYDVNIFI